MDKNDTKIFSKTKKMKRKYITLFAVSITDLKNLKYHIF